MARVFITGSSDGLGLMAGQLLVDQGHRVVLHARNDARAAETRTAAPKAEAVVVGDLASIAETKDLAAKSTRSALRRGHSQRRRRYREELRLTSDDLPRLFAINTLAPSS